MKNVDFHMHSSFSDGSLSPLELMKFCFEQGMRKVAVTDHDTVDHIIPCREEAKKLGIELVSGTELSVNFHDQRLHLLGYGIDPENQVLKKRLEYFHTAREERARKMISKLQKLGFVIEFDPIRALVKGVIGRPHLAQAICSDSRNGEKLMELQIGNSSQFVATFLCHGQAADVDRERLPIEEAINLIHGAGGISVLAHPAWTFRRDIARLQSLLPEIKAMGCDGIETFYSVQNREQTIQLHEWAEKFGFLETAGSDFHGPADAIFNKVGNWRSYGIKTNF